MRYILLTVILLFSYQPSFAQDKLDGSYKAYYDSGELKVEGQYKSQKRIGDWKSYHENGQVSSHYSYTDGKQNKERISYYENGIMSYKTEKVGDNYKSSGFYESGNLKYERIHNTGYFKGYFESGAVETEANYVNSELIGEWKQFYENGKLEWIVTYKDGYRDGLYQQFYENGDLRLEGNNYKDKMDGEERRYLPNTILEWKGNYSKGVLSSTWNKYDSKGNKIEKIKFRNGIPSNSEFNNILEPTKVADGVIERVPIYPGCGEMLTNKTRVQCMNQQVATFIGKNFNTNLSLGPDLNGRQKIYAIFKIDKTGMVSAIDARAPHPVLKAEAIRVIKLLPKTQPGTQRGKPVIMPFSIPIVFQIK